MPKRHIPSHWPKLPEEKNMRRLAAEIRRCYKDNPEGWSAVARKYGITTGLAWRIAWQGYEPRGADLRFRLGLPALVPTATCPRCGIVHVKRCPRSRSPKKSLFDYSQKELEWMIDHREEFDANQSINND